MNSCSLNLETAYQAFSGSLIQPMTAKSVDYLGLNLSERSGRRPVFKVYYSNKFSSGREHPLLQFLSEREMLRYFSSVADTLHPSCFRMDIALKARTDANITALFGQLDSMSGFFAASEKEIRKLAHMKITELPSSGMASLYHLGFIQNEDDVNLLKFHFFTRWCEDPDIPGKNSEYRDDFYLSYLKDSGIPQYERLARLMGQALKIAGGHLWMAGMDVGRQNDRKYKLYIKNPNPIYRELSGLFHGNLKEQLQDAASWHLLHPELSCEGAAFCLDSEEHFTINLYYGLDE